MLSFKKHDSTNAEIRPGDICIWSSKQGIQPAIYMGETKGNGNKGQFGRFQTPTGKHSIKYSSIVFAFDPMGKRRNSSKQVIQLVRKYYEGVK